MSDLNSAIIQALKSAIPACQTMDIAPETPFDAVAGFDSMSAVSFQVALAGAIGEKAHAVEPLPGMTVADYARCLNEV